MEPATEVPQGGLRALWRGRRHPDLPAVELRLTRYTEQDFHIVKMPLLSQEVRGTESLKKCAASAFFPFDPDVPMTDSLRLAAPGSASCSSSRTSLVRMCCRRGPCGFIHFSLPFLWPGPDWTSYDKNRPGSSHTSQFILHGTIALEYRKSLFPVVAESRSDRDSASSTTRS